ncbi:unnamed protein product, partial [Iphiclides podalirius]
MSPGLKLNAEIKAYSMNLSGIAVFKDRFGKLQREPWGPMYRSKTNDTRTARFDDLPPNTNYTVRLSAVTRTQRRGEEDTKRCSTPPAPPHPPRPRWFKIVDDDRYMLKLHLPRLSERNGPICCYRVFMVRLLPRSEWGKLPSPRDISVVDYEEAHGARPVLGAYLTDVFSHEKFPPGSDVIDLIMGDENSVYDAEDGTLHSDMCRRCLRRPRRPYFEAPPPRAPVTPPTTTTTTSAATTTEDEFFDEEDLSTAEPEEAKRDRRSYPGIDRSDNDYTRNPIMDDSADDDFQVKDGLLDPTANYTLFVEVIPGRPQDESVWSEYVNVLTPAASVAVPSSALVIEAALLTTCSFAAFIVLVMIIVCVVQTRRSRKLPPHAHVEMNPLQVALRYVVGSLGGRQQLISAVPPDMPPIPKEELAAAYAERQADSDYGFQKEFEMLPECFPDRTTHASEARENQPKNRYPDIKAYDQTRVKLSQVDGISGSDYINANYVMGYKERKQFICAQGPTDTTVNDFWRMIWEHGLELIVMLTNLEEYSKVKCSKYWPDEGRGPRAFGSIAVHHVSEKRYSDYIVRELRITKQPLNSEGQPIIENNGIAKRNGECKEAADGSQPNSPQTRGEARLVRQYHFLMWKDFAAPEHSYSILKFIKRVNEAWSNMVGRPVVVHCSAGVGRTGTLVALDCLLEQLRATGHVAVFNTVAELRRQRNFLVQSLKQYVFVYRALVEYAHYGDTEIPASRLKSSIDRLRNTPEGADKCLMEHEFEKMMNSPLAESVRSCAAGGGEELRARNRNADCLPYDRNRVILAPIPGRDFSTYINASFIEAYDNSEGFIITQDPLPNTIMDFWRMVSEHNVSTIVMLSELGEGKCPRYWDDGTAQYEHISVQYEESESCPYYTRRQFRVTNNKVSGEWSGVRQLQYQGWPTAAGHVPEVTRGLAELAELAAPPHAAAPDSTRRPLLVHCQSVPIALCNTPSPLPATFPNFPHCQSVPIALCNTPSPIPATFPKFPHCQSVPIALCNTPSPLPATSPNFPHCQSMPIALCNTPSPLPATFPNFPHCQSVPIALCNTPSPLPATFPKFPHCQSVPIALCNTPSPLPATFPNFPHCQSVPIALCNTPSPLTATFPKFPHCQSVPIALCNTPSPLPATFPNFPHCQSVPIALCNTPSPLPATFPNFPHCQSVPIALCNTPPPLPATFPKFPHCQSVPIALCNTPSPLPATFAKFPHCQPVPIALCNTPSPLSLPPSRTSHTASQCRSLFATRPPLSLPPSRNSHTASQCRSLFATRPPLSLPPSRTSHTASQCRSLFATRPPLSLPPSRTSHTASQCRSLFATRPPLSLPLSLPSRTSHTASQCRSLFATRLPSPCHLPELPTLPVMPIALCNPPSPSPPLPATFPNFPHCQSMPIALCNTPSPLPPLSLPPSRTSHTASQCRSLFATRPPLSLPSPCHLPELPTLPVSADRSLQHHALPPLSLPATFLELPTLPVPIALCKPLHSSSPPFPNFPHCHLGTERSSLFVALCILIWQLRIERRVDVNCVARKVRSQRARTIDTFLQYEFLHRAILNYAELHNLLEDS